MLQTNCDLVDLQNKLFDMRMHAIQFLILGYIIFRISTSSKKAQVSKRIRSHLPGFSPSTIGLVLSTERRMKAAVPAYLKMSEKDEGGAREWDDEG